MVYMVTLHRYLSQNQLFLNSTSLTLKERCFVGFSTYFYLLFLVGICFAIEWNEHGEMEAIGTAFYKDDLFWWENPDSSNIEWTFHSIDATLDGAASILISDIDSDSDMDVLCVSDDLVWWENLNGNGLLWAEHPILHNVSRIYPNLLTDMNGDGADDVLMVHNGDVVWLENKGTSEAWEIHRINNGERVLGYYVDYADINGDKTEDIIISSTSNASFDWRQRNIEHPDFWHSSTSIGSSTPFTPSDIHAVDLDSDGDMDVLYASPNPPKSVWSEDSTQFDLYGPIGWWENLDGQGKDWRPHLLDNSQISPHTVYSSDIDNDMDLDVVVVSENPECLKWLENVDGLFAKWEEHIIDSSDGHLGPRSVHIFDLDSDNDQDIIEASGEVDSFGWWENEDGHGLKWTRHSLIEETDIGGQSVNSADIDGDGDCDVIGSSNNGDYDISWFCFRGIEEEGFLYSEIFTSLTSMAFSAFQYDFPSDSVKVDYQVRSSISADSMGEWSDLLQYDGRFQGTDRDAWQRYEHEFFQYRVHLESIESPFCQVRVNSGFSYQQNLSQPDFALYRIPISVDNNEEGLISNPRHSWFIPSVFPAVGQIDALLTSPVDQVIDIFIFDSNGNLVAVSSNYYPVGIHAVCFDGLSAGVYVAVMNKGRGSNHRRIVVE